MLWESPRQGDSNEYHSVDFYGEVTLIIPKLSSNTLLICSTTLPLRWWHSIEIFSVFEPCHEIMVLFVLCSVLLVIGA